MMMQQSVKATKQNTRFGSQDARLESDSAHTGFSTNNIEPRVNRAEVGNRGSNIAGSREDFERIVARIGILEAERDSMARKMRDMSAEIQELEAASLSSAPHGHRGVSTQYPQAFSSNNSVAKGNNHVGKLQPAPHPRAPYNHTSVAPQHYQKFSMNNMAPMGNNQYAGPPVPHYSGNRQTHVEMFPLAVPVAEGNLIDIDTPSANADVHRATSVADSTTQSNPAVSRIEEKVKLGAGETKANKKSTTLVAKAENLMDMEIPIPSTTASQITNDASSETVASSETATIPNTNAPSTTNDVNATPSADIVTPESSSKAEDNDVVAAIAEMTDEEYAAAKDKFEEEVKHWKLFGGSEPKGMYIPGYDAIENRRKNPGISGLETSRWADGGSSWEAQRSATSWQNQRSIAFLLLRRLILSRM